MKIFQNSSFIDSKSPVTKEEKTSNGHRFTESNQSAFRRISSIKSEPTEKINEKSSKNGTSLSAEELLANKNSIPNPFLSPLLSSSTDFHSHLALLRPFFSQTLPFVPPLPPSTYWHAYPFLHPYLSNLRPPGLLPPTLPSVPSSSSSLQPKASTSTNLSTKKPSSATHYHQYTITNNNVLVPSSATLIDFIRRPTTSNAESTNTHLPTNNTKSKNLKKYKCDICSRAFSRSNTLVTHKVRRLTSNRMRGILTNTKINRERRKSTIVSSVHRRTGGKNFFSRLIHFNQHWLCVNKHIYISNILAHRFARGTLRRMFDVIVTYVH